jgi:hypothetical protein
VSGAKGETRTLYFHTGTHKTGTMALAAFFLANRSFLKERGSGYEMIQDSIDDHGNGQYLHDQIFGKQISHGAMHTLIEEYLGGNNVGLCSAASLSELTIGEWSQVLDGCRRLNVRPLTISYVRDVGPYYFEMHSEMLRTGKPYTDFHNFCASDHYRSVVDSLRNLRSIFGDDAMTIVHYESVSDNIELPILEALGCSKQGFDRSTLAMPINRSFTHYEKDFLGQVARCAGEQIAAELASHLLQRRPHLRTTAAIPGELIDLLQTRHAEDLAWINQSFFFDQPIVRVGDSMNKEQSMIVRDVIDWCVGKLGSSMNSSIEAVAAQLREIDWRNIGNLLVPSDFDPIAYLVWNSDLLKAGHPPFQHFIANGHNEAGRQWKWGTR